MNLTFAKTKKYFKSIVLILVLLGFTDLNGQSTKYVETAQLGNLSTSTIESSYYFSESITIVAPPSGSTTISSTGGDKFISPIATNAPPSMDKNFVRVEVPTIPIADSKALTLLGPDDKVTTYSYLDDLGRTQISTVVQAGPNYEDVVQPSYYDPTTGRMDKSYLSYAKTYSDPGQYVDGVAESQNYYDTNAPTGVTGDDKPFSYSKYDARGRVTSVVAPGEAWHQTDEASAKKTLYKYFIHNPSETDPLIDFPVAKWKIVAGEPVTDENYAANELTIVVVTDQEGQMVRTVKDFRGLTITTQSYDPDNSKWYGSYNVYDDFGRLAFIIPPILTSGIGVGVTLPDPSSIEIQELIFQYQYDRKGRVIKEKGPGAGWVEYVYDKWDRLILRKDEGKLLNGKDAWTYYKYDALNRLVMTGQVNWTTGNEPSFNEVPDAQMPTRAYEEFLSGAYTKYLSYPFLVSPPGGGSVLIQDYTVEKEYYYDNYAFNSDTSFDFSLPTGFTGTKNNIPTDLPTGSLVKIVGENQYLKTVTYYDEDRRILQSVTENHLGGKDIITNEFEWDGELRKMLLQHSSSTESVEVLNEYQYAHNGQLLKSFQTIDGGQRVEVGDYHYNAIGQLIEKNLHSTNGISYLQSVDYRYNIQGVMTNINDPDNLNASGDSDLFGMKYFYEEEDNPVGETGKIRRYDGVMNAITWNATNVTPSVDPDDDGPDGSTRYGIGYKYDGRNRLKSTNYGEAAGAGYDSKVDHFRMSATYDDNGNLSNLTRKRDDVEIDNLTYDNVHDNDTPSDPNDDYYTNKLQGVTDAGTAEGLNDYYSGNDYKYDTRGNMTEDLNKQITSIEYNQFELVEKITFYDGTVVDYLYDAVGNRLSKEVFDNYNNSIARVDYVGLIEYLDGEINQIFTDEGRAYKQGGTYHYEYFITDHQANNRVAFGNLPEREIYVATMEDNNAAYEESEFSFPTPDVRLGPIDPSASNNHTPLGEKSATLNAIAGKALGPAKVLTIANGDKVEIEVWAKYTAGGWNDASIPSVAATLEGALSFTEVGAGADDVASSFTSAINAASTGIFDRGNTDGEPEAYLQYMFFDASYSYVADADVSNFTAVNASSDGQYAKLSSGELTFNQAGYLLVYIANESNQNKDVHFDDLKITHASSDAAFRVTQINDYYPFGMPTANSWRAKGYLDPGLLYQSSFSVLDSLTGYYDFLSRNYDPALGRFFAVDPAGQFASPYVGMANAPHLGVDPNGETFWGTLAVNALRSLINNLGESAEQSLNGNGSFRDNFMSSTFSTGGSYSQQGWQWNANNGYGGFVPSQNSGSPIYGGLLATDPLDASSMGYTNFGYWSDTDSWFTLGYNFELGLPEPTANSYPSQYNTVTTEQKQANPGIALPMGIALEELLVALGITSLSQEVHKNSNRNGAPNHVYVIFSWPKNGTEIVPDLNDMSNSVFRVEKYGITSSDVPISNYVRGSLERPESQVARWRVSDPTREYDYGWMQKNLHGRMAAKTWESFYVAKYAALHKGDLPNRQIYPKASYWYYLKNLVGR